VAARSPLPMNGIGGGVNTGDWLGAQSRGCLTARVFHRGGWFI
jgi:hypothetical protein